MTEAELRAMLRKRCRVCTQKALARELGISLSGLNEVINKRKAPFPKLLRALGLRRVVTYVGASSS